MQDIRQTLIESGPYLTTLTLAFATPEPPSADAMFENLSARYGFESTQDEETPAFGGEAGKDQAWLRTLKIEDYPFTIMLVGYRGAADILEPAMRATAEWWEPGQFERLRSMGSHVEMITILEPNRPQVAYGFLLGAAALLAGTDHEFLGIGDDGSRSWKRPAELYDITRSEVPPSLYDIMRMMTVASDIVPDGIHLTTVGLLRCTLPDVVLPLVDPDLITPAEEFLVALASQMLEQGAGARELPFAPVGPDMPLRWMPAAALATAIPYAPVDHPRLLAPMRADEQLTTAASIGQIQRATQRITESFGQRGLLMMSNLETKILSKQANERVEWLERLWANSGDKDWLFACKVGFPIPSTKRQKPVDETPLSMAKDKDPEAAEYDGHEHIWFELRDWADGAMQGECVSHPIQIRDLAHGDLRWFKPSQLSDWIVRTEYGLLRPHGMAKIRGVLQRLGNSA